MVTRTGSSAPHLQIAWNILVHAVDTMKHF